MELSKTFDPKGMDDRWYEQWMKAGCFESKPDAREPYTIVIPPPNVTGILHMGHALNNTIQDVLIRRARMQGKNACWVPGTDHASIATEAKVVQMLREKGINKSKISREEFLKYAWEWKEKYGGIILQQLKKLGCSCDWSRTAFTMDAEYYQSVIGVFIDLYEKGLIYRGFRMIHWDPKAKTALSDEEVFYKEVKSKLYFINYQLETTNAGHEKEFITIATVRPETILGDTAICVNPNDERYKNLVGRLAFVPLLNRSIPIIADEYVAMDFGTGALKVTPAHDTNDYQLGLKHELPVIDVLNEDGTMSEAAQLYVGMDRFECRKKIVSDLQEKGLLEKVEEYTNQLGFSERTDAVIEPRLSMQWWCRMKELAKPALDAVVNEEIKFYPKKFVNLYRNWMENIKDWCISRQLWWGHRIPAWYTPSGEYVMAESREEAFKKATSDPPEFGQVWGLGPDKNLKIEDLKQDDDVLDTWFSSWLWPIEVFHGFSNPDNEDINYYFPTTTLVTAPEIIFFWVARMIMSGFEYRKEKPFSHVYFTGTVRDKQGRKMSKSLGNSPDLLELIDRYGADAVRFGILISAPAGNDLIYDEKLVEQGRNFNNKIWNALRLIKSWKTEGSQADHGNTFAVEWFSNKINATLAEIQTLLNDFQISSALKVVYSLIWDDFCSWYLEMIKPEFGMPIDRVTYRQTVDFFEQLMKLLHPFQPFITEEIYHLLKERNETDFIMLSDYPNVMNANAEILRTGNFTLQLITGIRDLRLQKNIKSKDRLKLFSQSALGNGISEMVMKLAGINSIEKTSVEIANSFSFFVGANKFFLEAADQIDLTKEKSRLEKDLEYQKGFLESVMKKLSNEKFVSNAKPDVLDREQKKAGEAKEKIRLLEEQLKTIEVSP